MSCPHAARSPAYIFVQASKKHKTQSEDTSHTLGIVASLFSNLASDTPARIRLLAKFVENTYEKADKLLEIRDSAQSRLTEVEQEIEAEKRVSTYSSILLARDPHISEGVGSRRRKD